MSNKLSVGDVVQLKSGGPDMTVTGVVEHGMPPVVELSCAWFIEGDDARYGRFPPEALVKVEDNE